MDFRVLHDLGYFEPRDRFYNEGTSVPEPAALASFFSGVITGAVRPRHKGLYGFPDRQWRAAAKLLPFLKVMDTPTTPFTTPDRQVQNAFQSALVRDRELPQPLTGGVCCVAGRLAEEVRRQQEGPRGEARLSPRGCRGCLVFGCCRGPPPAS